MSQRRRWCPQCSHDVSRNEVIAGPGIMFSEGFAVWSTKLTLFGTHVLKGHRPTQFNNSSVDINHTNIMAPHDRPSTRVQFDHGGIILRVVGVVCRLQHFQRCFRLVKGGNMQVLLTSWT
jgi:hypothetical protein